MSVPERLLARAGARPCAGPRRRGAVGPGGWAHPLLVRVELGLQRGRGALVEERDVVVREAVEELVELRLGGGGKVGAAGEEERPPRSGGIATGRQCCRQAAARQGEDAAGGVGGGAGAGLGRRDRGL